MATVLITSTNICDSGNYFAAECGKTSADIYISKAGYINVCCKNASHKAWKQSGRYFSTKEEALDGYKSSEMKSILSAVLEA